MEFVTWLFFDNRKPIAPRDFKMESHAIFYLACLISAPICAKAFTRKKRDRETEVCYLRVLYSSSSLFNLFVPLVQLFQVLHRTSSVSCVYEFGLLRGAGVPTPFDMRVHLRGTTRTSFFDSSDSAQDACFLQYSAAQTRHP